MALSPSLAAQLLLAETHTVVIFMQFE